MTEPSANNQAGLETLKNRRFLPLSHTDTHWGEIPDDCVKLGFSDAAHAAHFRDIVQWRAQELSRIYGRNLLAVDCLRLSLDDPTPSNADAPHLVTIRAHPTYQSRQSAYPFQATLTLDALNLLLGPEFAAEIAVNTLHNNRYDAQALWQPLTRVEAADARHVAPQQLPLPLGVPRAR